MHRRTFIASGVAACLPGLAGAAYRADTYVPGMIGELGRQDSTVILNFNATWSLTCQIKREILAGLKAENPDYARHLGFIDIDWDTHGPSQMAQRLKVERRSTLLALHRGEPFARLVAETDADRVRAFLDEALSVARQG